MKIKKHILLRAMDQLLTLLGKVGTRCAKIGEEVDDPERWNRVQDNLQAIMTLMVTLRDEVKALLQEKKNE
jgi:hypothetical protein